MKKAFATLIPLCIIGFVGFWISTIILGTNPENSGKFSSSSQYDDKNGSGWSAGCAVKNSEYTATIAASENLELAISDVKATVVPFDGEDIEVYVKNASNRSVNVSLKRNSSKSTIIKIDASIRFGWFNLSFFDFNSDDRIVEIKVPKKTFERAKIDLGSGSAAISGINAAEYDIDMGSGNMEFSRDKSEKIRSFRLDMGSGTSVFSGIYAESYKINMGSGSCTISDLAGTGDIDMGSGSLELSFMDSPTGKFDMGSGHTTMIIPENSDTTFKFDIGSGGVNFNACGINESRRNHNDGDIVLGNGENTFDIDIGSGSVDVASSEKAPSIAEQVQ